VGSEIVGEDVRELVVGPASAGAAVVGSSGSRWAKVGLLSAGHVLADGYCMIVTPLLAYMAIRLGVSKQEASNLFTAVALGASISQIGWGYLCDRFNGRWILILSPTVASVVVAIGWTNHYWVIMGLILLAGAGTAAFHPVSGVLAGRLVEPHGAVGLSVFLGAGMIGVGAFPVIVTQLVAVTDLANIWPLALPGPVLSVLFWRAFGREMVATDRGPAGRFSLMEAFRGRRRSVVLLFLTAMTRAFPISAYQVAMSFMVAERFGRIEMSGYILGLFSGALGVGGVIGSVLSSRLDERKLLIGSLAAGVPAAFVFSFAPGYWVLAGAGLAGAVMGSTVPLAISMGQRLVPRGAQVFTGMMMGLSWGVGGVLAPQIVTPLMDSLGYSGSTFVCSLSLVVAVAAAIALPRNGGRATAG